MMELDEAKILVPRRKCGGSSFKKAAGQHQIQTVHSTT